MRIRKRHKETDRNRKRRRKNADATEAGGKAARKACGRKRRYPDRMSAESRAQQYEVRFDAPPLRAYRCPYCGGWHLTKGRWGK